jgi:hypothetical protein
MLSDRHAYLHGQSQVLNTDLIDSSNNEIKLSREVLTKREIFQLCDTEHMISKFIKQRDLLPQKLRCFIHPYEDHEYRSLGAKIYLSSCYQGGFAIIGEELVSVFSLPGAHLGDQIVAEAVENGARELCFMNATKDLSQEKNNPFGKLYYLYESHGFREVHRLPWNQKEAHAEWDYLSWGKPEFIVMKYFGE